MCSLFSFQFPYFFIKVRVYLLCFVKYFIFLFSLFFGLCSGDFSFVWKNLVIAEYQKLVHAVGEL